MRRPPPFLFLGNRLRAHEAPNSPLSTGERLNVKSPASQIHNSRCCARLLPALLSVIAGSADVTSFLGLGLFSAHVTGNLVILTAHIVAGRADNACLALSVPIF